MNTNKATVLNALMSSYMGQRDVIVCNLEIYTSNPTSIPEHVNFIEYVDNLVAQLTEINDKIETVDSLLGQLKQTDSQKKVEG